MYKKHRWQLFVAWGLYCFLGALSGFAVAADEVQLDGRVVIPSIQAYTNATTAILADMPNYKVTPAPSRIVPLGKSFLWGVAQSGFQSEGSFPDSSWTRYIANGKAKAPYLNSVDFYHRYADDIKLAAALGVKVFRFSVEWARVEPRKGYVDPNALLYYDDVIKKIVEAGMTPMITIDHMVYPGWVADEKGWKGPNIVNYWMINAKRVVDRYAKYNPIWITINEPFIYMIMEVQKGSIWAVDLPLMNRNLITVHRQIYDYIHQKQAGALVSSNQVYLPVIQALVDATFLDRTVDKMDFIGFDYYYGISTTDFSALFNSAQGAYYNIKSQPEGIYYALRRFAQKYPDQPLYVIENGLSTNNGIRPDGLQKSTAIRDTVYWLQRAKMDGFKLMGYNYWGLTDSYEWGSYDARFGLYKVDVLTDSTLKRTPTDGVAAYIDVVKTGGVPNGYTPQVKTQLCSLVDPPSSCTRPVRIHSVLSWLFNLLW